MDTKKLAKIIKVIVEHELKKQLPKLIEKGVERKLNEMKLVTKTTKHEILEEEQDMFSLANAVLDNDRNNSNQVENTISPIVKPRKLSTNSMLNKILNETAPFSSKHRNPTDTIQFGQNLAAGGADALNASMASNMGLSTANANPTSNGNGGGMGVKTGLPGLDRILNRDNSALVKKFATRK